MVLIRLSHKIGLKMPKSSIVKNNKLQTLRKHKLVKPLNSLAVICIICIFISISIHIYSAKIILND